MALKKKETSRIISLGVGKKIFKKYTSIMTVKCGLKKNTGVFRDTVLQTVCSKRVK